MKRRSDPEVLTIPEAARLADVADSTFRGWLHDEEFATAVVAPVPGAWVRISRPRLLRRLHGDQARPISA